MLTQRSWGLSLSRWLSPWLLDTNTNPRLTRHWPLDIWMGSKLLPHNPYHKLLVSESSKTVPHNKSVPTKRCGGSQHQLRNIMVNDCESGCFENGRGVQKQKPRISGVVAARVLCSLCSPCCPPRVLCHLANGRERASVCVCASHPSFSLQHARAQRSSLA